MSSRFYTIVFFLSYCFKLFIFWIGSAHELKAHFVTSSVVTSHKWNLRIQIGQVLLFCQNRRTCPITHNISARYHIFRLFTFEGKTFGSVDVFKIGHRGVTWLETMETSSPKFFWNRVLSLLSVSETYLEGNKIIAPRIPKIFVPITPPRNLLAAQLEKKTPASIFLIFVSLSL